MVVMVLVVEVIKPFKYMQKHIYLPLQFVNGGILLMSCGKTKIYRA